MAKEKNNPHRLRQELGAWWRSVRAIYRYANMVTHHVFGVLFWLLMTVYFLCCVLFLTLRYVVLPGIDGYKSDIEKLTGRALGHPVSIAKLEADWRGLRPHLTLSGVEIHDQRGKQALVLPKVSATIGWLSVAALDLRLERLAIDKPDLEIARDADGNLTVGGIFMDTHKKGDGKGLDWILSQREIVIRDGRLHWHDAKRAAPELALSGVDFVLTNQWRRHRFALRAVPPEAFAGPLDVRADFRHPYFSERISDVSQWTGEVYADLQHTDLTAWKAYVDYPVDVAQGYGAVRAWLNFDRARIVDFTADLSLSNVSTRLRPDLQPLDLTKVNGRISMSETTEGGTGKLAFGTQGHAVSLRDFSFETKEGLVFPTTTLSESYVPAKDGQPEQFEIKAKLLELHTLADFAERLPLSTGQRELLADFTPRGRLKDFVVKWQGSYPRLVAYNVKGDFSGLSLKAQPARPALPASGKEPARAAVPGIPGFDNLTGTVDASDKGGSFALHSRDVKLDLPGYFGEPVMPFKLLDVQAGWSFQKNDQLMLQVEHLTFEQDGLAGTLSGSHLMPLKSGGGKPLGRIDMTGKIAELDLSKVGSYLPSRTPPHLQRWLSTAMAGKAQNITVKVKGDLADFPFHKPDASGRPKGVFVVTAKIADGKLNYVPQLSAKDGKSPLWPLAEEIKGTIRFDRSRMEIHGDTAKTHGVDLKNVSAIVPDLSHDSQLEIDGHAEGALQDFIHYVNDSPVTTWIGGITEETKTSGNAALALKLHMPLTHLRDTRVEGELNFAGNDINLFSALPTMRGSTGKLMFSEKGIDLPPLKTVFLGAPASITGTTQHDGTVVVKATGSVTAEGVRQAFAGPVMQRIGQRMNGSSRFSVGVTVKKKRRPEIVVESTLQGLALDLPSPLNKSVGESMPFKLEMAGITPSDAPLLRDEIKVSLGSMMAARYERQKAADKSAAWQVVRGGIGINVAPPQPDSGVVANISLRTLNIDAWNRLFSLITSAGKAASTPAANALGLSQYIDPEVLAARAGELIIGGKKLENVVVGASHQKSVWQANIDSNQVSGYITWFQSPTGQGLGRVTARLTSLIIPKTAASEVTDLLEGKNTATQIPALDITADNFELFEKRFGRLEMIAYNAGAGATREWRIGKLSIVNSDGDFRASGRWTNMNGDSESSLSYNLDIIDAGRLLDRLGFTRVLHGGKGKMAGELQWKGLPFSLDVPSLSGKFDLNLGSGQFLKADPAAAKLLGVLSLQSLPRRLSLDFRDVFSEGFAFDGIVATASISHGVAKTDNFKMRGVTATVLMDGTADIVREATNLHVVVIPDVNAGAASVVYGLAVNPVIGLGTFLAQLFLREPLMRAFTFEYQITGPWTDPVIAKLARKSDNRNPDGALGTGVGAERIN